MSEWIKTAKVGDKVVCVDAANVPGKVWRHGDAIFEGQIYAILDMWVDHEGDVVLEFVEKRRSWKTSAELGFRAGYKARRFRPVTPRNADISFAHDILRKATKPVEECV